MFYIFVTLFTLLTFLYTDGRAGSKYSVISSFYNGLLLHDINFAFVSKV